MKRHVAPILFVLSLLWLLIAAAFVQADDGIMPYRAVCQINMPGCQGSGTLIAKRADGTGLVLTCRHVADAVGNQGMCVFYWAGGSFVSYGQVIAVVEGKDYDTDLALAVIDKCPPGITPRPVAPFKMSDGPWIGAGFRGGIMRITPVITVAGQMQDGKVMIPTPLIKGQSGGALFNRRGEVVAVLVASDFATLGIASDGENLKRLVDQYLSR